MKEKENKEIINAKHKTIIFNDSIDETSVKVLIEDIEKELEKDNTIVNLYFTTNGGSAPEGIILIDYINRNKDKIVFHPSWTIASVGSVILMKVKCKVNILEDTFVLIHDGNRDVDYMDAFVRKEPLETYLVQNLLNSNEKYLEEYKQFYKLTEDEINTIKEGKDVIINNDRLQNIFNAI